RFNGEVISADSRQIYRKMDIGTGKVEGQLLASSFQLLGETVTKNLFISEKIPHYLIDVARPDEDFNVSHFKTQANLAIEEIISKGKLPIICGGTGFWIQAVTDNLNLPKVAPNEKLRSELDKFSAAELFEKLAEIDPERAGNIDKQNKYRLVRALEIIDAIGKVPPLKKDRKEYDFLQIGINVSREILNAKIKKRLDERFELGMIEEVENLHKNGVSHEWMEKIGLEYRWIARFLQNKISLEEMKEKLYFDIIHYAKRQMTWFGRNKKIIWKDNYHDIEKEVHVFLEI
ncbi:MAG: tRNA dimethylallyltransferase, partial [uncultured bacterium]